MNDFIFMEEEVTKSGRGGTFIAKANFRLDNLFMPLYRVPVKIDTGCSVSTIPLSKVHVSEYRCRFLKEQDIKNKTPYLLSYGVETGGLKHEVPYTDDEKMDCPAMKFLHKIYNLEIDGVILPINDIYINYNRAGNILIGMDILEKMDIHMGVSRILEKEVFIACPRDKLNMKISDEYYNELDKHFGLKKI